jgi:hypothetical protein
MMDHFQKIFNDWSSKIVDSLEGADNEKNEGSKDDGPQQELDYWKNRMRKLTGISE